MDEEQKIREYIRAFVSRSTFLTKQLFCTVRQPITGEEYKKLMQEAEDECVNKIMSLYF